SQPDPDYVVWYLGLLDALGDGLPILFADDHGPAPYQLGHLRIIRPTHGTIPGDGTYPLPPGDSLAGLLRRHCTQHGLTILVPLGTAPQPQPHHHPHYFGIEWVAASATRVRVRTTPLR